MIKIIRVAILRVVKYLSEPLTMICVIVDFQMSLKDLMMPTRSQITPEAGVDSWKSSKQTCISRSTIDIEFIALEKASSMV